MRALPLEVIHAEAVKLARRRGMNVTAGRLAACDVDDQIKAIVSQLVPLAWDLRDDEILKACGRELWIQFLQAEINLQGG